MLTRRKLKVAGALVPLLAAGQGLVPGLVATAADAAPAAQAPLTASSAAALAANATQKVIVELKAQPTAGPDAAHRSLHLAQVQQAQSPVIGELRAVKAPAVTAYKLIPAIAATVSSGEEARLAANPAVARVIPDSVVHVSAPAATAGLGAASPAASTANACAPAGSYTIPEALQTMHVATSPASAQTAQGLGYTGAGVKVGFIADGVDVNNPDFIRPDGSHVVVDYQDFSGVGTAAPTGGEEAYIDSSSIAAQGEHTYDVSHYSATGDAKPCNVRVLGVAPGASLVDMNVFGNGNNAYTSNILDGIDYAVFVDHVQVLNESFGSNPFPDSASLDVTKQANDAAAAAGTTVVVSSGDAGITNTQGSPSTDPNVISAGATTTYQAFLQSGYGGARLPGVTGQLSDNISSLSSSGFSQAGRTVDVVAPGEENWVLCTADPTLFTECANLLGQPSPVILGGGTSESAPLTAGTAALVIEAYAKSHGGTDPSPGVVKQIITSTARDIRAPGDLEGAGEVDAYRAVLAAASYQGATTTAAGNGLLTSANQLNAVGRPGASQKLTETVTNDGSASQTVGVSARTLGAYSSVGSGSVTLSDSASPKFVDYQGNQTNLQKVTFTVPSGVDRLQTDVAYQGTGGASNLASRVRLDLISPSGKLGSYDLPQGNGNHDSASVTSPAAGRWTAYIWSRTTATGGYVGPVLWSSKVASFTSFGTVRPSSLSLAPGQSAPVTLTVATPAAPGDQAGSLVLSTGTGPAFTRTSTVPVTLRSLIPTPNPSSIFTASLVGGNGRQTTTGQTAYYQFDLPAGLPALNADITVAANPDNPFFATLIDPATSTAAATASNSLLQGSPVLQQTVTPELGAQLHVVNPSGGRWTLIVDFYDHVSGTTLSDPFTVEVNRTPVPAVVRGFSPTGGVVPRGSTVTSYVKVTNDGPAPETYFIDARSAQTVALPLTPISGNAALTVPVPLTEAPPQYLVPTHTAAIATAATSTVPITYDYSWAFGDPDLGATSGPNSGNASGAYAPIGGGVPAGEWSITPAQVGPAGASGETPVVVDTAMTALTKAFDPDVTSPTGDLWEASFNALTPFNPYIVNPGQSVLIPVSITATGKSGTVHKGTVYVASASMVTYGFVIPEANDVAAIPFDYTVK